MPRALLEIKRLPNIELFYVLGMRSLLSFLLLKNALPDPMELDTEARECFTEALKVFCNCHRVKTFDYNRGKLSFSQGVKKLNIHRSCKSYGYNCPGGKSAIFQLYLPLTLF